MWFNLSAGTAAGVSAFFNVDFPIIPTYFWGGGGAM